MAISLPKLEVLDRTALPAFTTPIKRIHEISDVPDFLISQAYRDIGLFIMQLNHAVCPRNRKDTPVPLTFSIPTKHDRSAPVESLHVLLTEIESLIEDAPPAPGPRRFGNLSFRTWHSILEGKVDGMLAKGALGNTIAAVGGDNALKEIKSYLLGGFGSAQRLDYGTGHELSFVAFLGCLWKLGHFKTDKADVEIEREIVFSVIETYLRLVRKLITTYTLEPAGSHGVWGLDDHSFVPYIFGSAQLTRPIEDNDPMPLDGSVRGAPRTGDITKALVVEDNRRSNMYFSAIGFINDIKKGPFWEHSPMLFDISGVRDGWGKINKGMIKMYNAEVLSKFPVVQHFPFGSLFSWNKDLDALPPVTHAVSPSGPIITPAPTGNTAAPWTTTSRTPLNSTAQGSLAGRMPPPASQRLAASSEDTHVGGIPPIKAPWAK